MTSRILVAVFGALVLSMAGLLPAGAEPAARAVASFSILADLLRQVGGDRVVVTALVGPDGDAHTFDPSPADAAKLADAAVIVVNGLGLEGWMDRLIKASGTRGRVVVASKDVVPLRTDEAGHGGGAKRIDPHAWQDVANVERYVTVIRDALTEADAAGTESYGANATRYLAELKALDGDIRAAIGRIPANRRKIITTHDAFGYFGRAYGVDFIAPQALSTQAEPTGRDVARIIRQIKQDRVPAVFLENISDPRLMNRIARESGASIGGKLYSDALSEAGGPAATYIDLMRSNVRALEAALADH